MTKSVAEKMGIKPDSRVVFIHAPAGAIKAMEMPKVDVASSVRGDFDYIHLFAKTEDDLHTDFSRLKKYLKPTGMLWVSWPKGGQLGTDLTLTIVIKIGYDYGLVESKSLSIDTTWSALKFTHPKKGKVYNNSYGKLKE